MPRKCGLCKKEGHNKSNCENAHYKGEYNYKGERHGKGTYDYKLSKYKNMTLEGAKYEGDWVNGKREGKGVMIYGKPHYKNQNGQTKYDGEWKNDKQHGKGIMYYLNGLLNEGEWKEGKFVSEKEFSDGSKYMGQFDSRGYMSGGTITRPNGDIIEGFRLTFWSHYHSTTTSETIYSGLHINHMYRKKVNNFTGRASSLIYSNGDKFEGSIDVGITTPILSSAQKHNTIKSNKYLLKIKGLYMQNGSMTYKKNGKSFRGQCQNKGGKVTYRQGEGYLEIVDSEGEYCGNAVVGYNRVTNQYGDKQKLGLGKMIYKNGDIYDGSWFHNKKGGGKRGYTRLAEIGQGIMTYANGDKYEGGWKEDTYSGQGVKTWANGDKYDGGWVWGKYSRQGVKTWANGDKYNGGWNEGKYSGQGVKTWANGDKYKGGWNEGKYSGFGTFTNKNNDSYRGIWKNGMKDDIFVAYNKNKLIGVYRYTRDVITVEIK
jgi:hypothetical protein